MESWSVALSFESVFENNILDFLLNLDLNQFWKKVRRGKQTVKDVQWILTVTETLTTFAPDITYNVTWFHGVTLLEQGCHQELGARDFPRLLREWPPGYFYWKIEEK